MRVDLPGLRRCLQPGVFEPLALLLRDGGARDGDRRRRSHSQSAPSDLYPLLPEHWVEHFDNTVDKGASQEYYPPRSPVAGRRGGLAELREAVFEQGGAELAISSCLYAVDSVHNPDVAAALATATNDWQSREWLEREPRLRGSIVAPIQLPAAAAEEIERCADRPGFVQVLIPVRTEHPLGSRLYHPLWKTIEQSGLVAAIHFGGAPVMPPTPTGWPSFFLEEYTAMAQVFATQLTSMIVEGVFDACPDLRVVFLESGFTWIPSHLWRMDKEWRNLRRLVPWVRRPPSDYFREHVRVGIQPLDSPPDPRISARSSTSSARTTCCSTPATIPTSTPATPAICCRGCCRSR